MIDTHVHLNLPDYPDLPGLIERAKAVGVDRFVVPGLDVASSQKALALAETHPEIIPAIGLHPLSEPEDFALFEAIAQDKRVKAIGEIGTDSKAGPWEAQEKRFRSFVELAIRTQKPVLIHIRDTWENTFLILEDYPELAGRAVIHCFTGGKAEAGRIRRLGLLVSVTAILARPALKSTHDVLRDWPLDQLMLETDGPYLAWPGEPWPNEPKTVARVAQLVAEIKGISVEEVMEQTTRTAERFFGLE